MEDNKIKKEFDFSQLPPELMAEVIDFAEFVLKKYSASTVIRSQTVSVNHRFTSSAIERESFLQETAETPAKTFDFSWAGGLKDLADEYSAVELQHKANEWR